MIYSLYSKRYVAVLTVIVGILYLFSGRAMALEYEYLLQSEWGGGGMSTLIVRNNTDAPVTHWQVNFSWLGDEHVDFAWNATVNQSGNTVTATCNPSFCVIPPGEAKAFGFVFSASQKSIIPTSIVVKADGGATEPPGPVTPTPELPTTPPNTIVHDQFNYVLGTQTIYPLYGFTNDGRLVETAKEIKSLGSNLLKFSLSPYSYQDLVTNYQSYAYQFVKLARDVPDFKQVLDMDFAYYMIWLEDSGHWMDNNGMDQQELDLQYSKIYNLAEYLLTTYNNTGKTFMFGNWELDWQLVKTVEVDPATGNSVERYDDSVVELPDLRIQGLIDFLNIRQKAIDDALANVPHNNVSILQYIEVNRVESAMQGKERVTNMVLPHTNADLVSYSAYDIPNKAENADINKLDAAMTDALNFIDSHLPAKAGVPFDNRVFIGEYGYASSWFLDHGDKAGETQALLTKGMMKVALNWGTPFILYWQIYDNEWDGYLQNYRGFWLVDQNGVKQPSYFLHQNFLTQAKAWVADFTALHDRPPTSEEYRQQALKIIDAL
ncbi:cellulose-binding domain-containing protein [Vibrio sp. S4M6]|uniref:cellulose binding domain-containing protein n=1 Tax=Vibrio sinus TaxID=2946865 RepID=UPI00202A340D|nr:cellulose binding domain-containing protein [Vibrio sinus]MCL9781746.1 cellulose-binding domain-containing protein [Vibrio sinus]